MAKNGKARLRLWQQDPHCHWCGRVTVYRKVMIGQRPNDATVDHIHSKLDPERHASETEPHEIVLACRACNGLRAHRENIALSPEEKRRRSWGAAGEIYRVVNEPAQHKAGSNK